MPRKTCRACLSQNDIFDGVTLNNSVRSLEIQAELRLCLPELNINLVEDAFMCFRCVDSLHKSYIFKNQCLWSEERIRNFLSCNKNNSIDELTLPHTRGVFVNVDVIDELNSVLDEVLQPRSVVVSNILQRIDVHSNETDNTYTLSKSVVQGHINVNRSACKVNMVNVMLEPNEVRFACSMCYQHFNSRSLLCHHIHSLHKAIKQKVAKRYSCELRNRPYCCNLCEYKGKRKDYLKDHMKRKHKNCNMIKCPVNGLKAVKMVEQATICNGKEKISQKQQSVFVADQHGIHTYVSTFGMATLEPSQSENHKIKRYICDLCDKELKNQTSLKKHMKKHSGQFPFFCAKCRFRSKSKNEYKSHLLDHLIPKKFACKMCDYSSDSKGNIRVHIRRHLKV